MKTRAAVAFEASKPLEIVEVDLEGPKAGEVLVEIMATGICHTDAYTLDGFDSEGIFPSILGHEGAGIVREVGAGRDQSVKPGDHVIPLYTPECRQCKSCLSRQDQPLHRDPRDPGQGPDARRHQPLQLQGRDDLPLHGLLDLLELHRPARDRGRRRSARTRRSTSCYIGCGVTTGVGAVINTAKVEPGDNVVVFGLGGIGLNVIQGAKLVGADRIVGVDINPAKEEWGRKFGMTDFVNPKEVDGDVVPHRNMQVRADRRRRRLQLRLHRQYRGHAPGARMLPPRLGPVDHHRRRRSGQGNRHPAVPARHRPQLARHRVRRRQGPHRRAEDRRLVHGRQDRRSTR